MDFVWIKKKHISRLRTMQVYSTVITDRQKQCKLLYGYHWSEVRGGKGYSP
jgi:hypothetical protein